MDAYPNSKYGRTFPGVPFVEVPLEIDRALDRIEGVRELEKKTIPDRLDLSTPMDFEKAVDQPLLLSEQPQRGRLVLLGERREPYDVGEYDGSEPPVSGHESALTPDGLALGACRRVRKPACSPHEGPAEGVLSSCQGGGD